MQNELEDTKKQHRNARQTVADRQREIDRLNYELHIEKTQNSRTSWDSERKRLTTQLRKKEGELTKLKESMKVLKEDLLKSARDDHNRNLAATQKTIKENSENDQIARNIRALQQQLRETRAENEEKDKNIIRLQEEEIAKRAKFSQMQEDYKKMETNYTRNADAAIK